MAQDSEILLRKVFTHPAVLFTERYDQAIVQAVFDASMRSDGFGDGRDAVFEAGDEIGRFDENLTVDIVLSSPIPKLHALAMLFD